MASVCLNMIVRDESAVVRRALESVREHVDYWVVVDTGSTDETPDIVRDALADVPGELHRHPWVDFAHNRNAALELAKDKADYVLFMDADMTLEAAEPFAEELEADAYLVRYAGPLDYHQVMLVSTRHAWRYEGVTHEALASETARRFEKADFVRLRHWNDGGGRGDKLERDLALLREGLAQEPGNTRYMFYLAMTARDLGLLDEALEWYGRRVAAGGWPEEVWCSLYHIAQVKHRRGDPWPEVMEAYLRAYQYRPSRLEPLYPLARHYRERREFHLGYLFARLAAETPYPEDILFVEKNVYDFELPMEHATCAHWVGRCAEALEVYNRLQDCPTLPPLYQNAILRNRKFSVGVLQPPAPRPLSRSNTLKVVVPFYNPGHALDNCIASLLAQDFEDFEAILVDDASTDGSHRRVPADDPRFTLLRNPRRLGGARNFHTVFTEHCEADDIVVHLDGDDWLAVHDALSYIDAFYNAHDCWVMYGQYRLASGQYGIARPYPSRESFAAPRRVWYASAIRTFRAGLYHKIGEQDPGYSCMKDPRGEWFTEAMDMAVMYPVLELAGFDRVRFNDRVLYVYNTDNPLNVHKTRRREELRSNREILAKPRFEPVTDYR